MINLLVNSTAVVGASIHIMSEEGSWFQYGNVVMLKKKDCIVLVTSGEQSGKKIRLPLEYPIGGVTVDGINYVIDVPEVTPTVTVPRVKLAEGQKSKIQMCREIHTKHVGSDPATIKALFVSEAQCTVLSANTYFLSIKKNG